MRKFQLKDLITKVHFFLLGFGILNFLLKEAVEISLDYQIAYSITALIYLSGSILFFWNLRLFRKSAIYFSIYVITPVLTLIFRLFGGIFLGILTSIVFYPVQPNELKFSEENFRIYENQNGFLGNCCPHIVTEKRWIILERKIKEFNVYNEINLKNSSIRTTKGRTELKIIFNEDEFYELDSKNRDTIILLERE